MRATSADFLAAADMLEFGEVTPQTHARIRQMVSAQLRADVPKAAREAIANAYRARGEDVPEWCRDE